MNTVLIPVGQDVGALVDAADAEWLGRYTWYRHSDGYAYRRENRQNIYMHRAIVNPVDGLMVDHMNGNGLDNRRANLRACTARQNQQNRRAKAGRETTYKGVWWDNERNRWRAGIVIDGVYVHLGRFANDRDAAMVYDAAARDHFGAFALLNFDIPLLATSKRVEQISVFRDGDRPHTPRSVRAAAQQVLMVLQ